MYLSDFGELAPGFVFTCGPTTFTVVQVEGRRVLVLDTSGPRVEAPIRFVVVTAPGTELVYCSQILDALARATKRRSRALARYERALASHVGQLDARGRAWRTRDTFRSQLSRLGRSIRRANPHRMTKSNRASRARRRR